MERSVAVGDVSAAADDTCYRVLLANIEGWSDRACNGQEAGTEGENRAIEALSLESSWTTLCLRGHVQDQGDDPFWSCETSELTAVTGTKGLSRRLEGVHIRSWNGPDVCAQAHVQDEGWQQPARCGQQIWVGTSNQGKRMEKIKIWKR